MSDKTYIGRAVAGLERYQRFDPISRVTLLIDDETYVTAGDDTGRTLEASLPWGTTQLAAKILARVKGYSYHPFAATDAIFDPAIETGDGVTVGGIYSQLASTDITWDNLFTADISAPCGAEIDHEYPYVSSATRETNRKIAQTRSLITKTAEEITLEVNNLAGKYTQVSVTLDGLTVTDQSGTTRIRGNMIETDTLYVNAAHVTGKLTAGQISLTGAITFEDLSSGVSDAITGAQNTANAAADMAVAAASTVSGWTYSGTTYINGAKILTGTVTASKIQGGVVTLLNAAGGVAGDFTLRSATSGAYAVDLRSYAAMHIYADDGDLWMQSANLSAPYLWLRSSTIDPTVTCNGNFQPPSSASGEYNLGSSGSMWDGVYSMTCAACTSDRNAKYDISDIPESYVKLFMALRPRLYKYNDGTSGRVHVGYIAQEVEAAMEAAGITSQEFAALVIGEDEAGERVYMLRYEELIALHTLMIQRMVSGNGQ